jgi:VanZ family protein
MQNAHGVAVWFGPRARWVLWSVCLLLWTVALLTPQPMLHRLRWLPPELRFWAAKTLHVTVYGLLAVLTGWLMNVTPRSRWLLLGLICLHALGTEFGQRFVPGRTGSWRDVGLDHLGIVLGLATTWRWWRSPAGELGAGLPAASAPELSGEAGR